MSDNEDKSQEEQNEEHRQEVVGTAANPKGPEAGSVGMEDGSKLQEDEVPAGTKTNVAEGASVADGGERVALAGGLVVNKDDVADGTVLTDGTVVKGDPAATPDDRGTSPIDPDAVSPAETNAGTTKDPLINTLFDPSQASIKTAGTLTGTTGGDEYPGNIPKDDRFKNVPPVLLPPLKSAIDRVEAARKFGQHNAAHKALDDLDVVIAPIDAGQGHPIRDWAKGIREDVLADQDADAKAAEADDNADNANQQDEQKSDTGSENQPSARQAKKAKRSKRHK